MRRTYYVTLLVVVLAADGLLACGEGVSGSNPGDMQLGPVQAAPNNTNTAANSIGVGPTTPGAPPVVNNPAPPPSPPGVTPGGNRPANGMAPAAGQPTAGQPMAGGLPMAGLPMAEPPMTGLPMAGMDAPGAGVESGTGMDDPGAGVEPGTGMEPSAGDDSDDDSGSIFGGLFGDDDGEDDAPPPITDGMCCDDGDCLCHGPSPNALTNRPGPYRVATERARTGTLYYPRDAEPPFAGVAICPGFLNTGPEMGPWGQFYASHGIVTMVTNTGAADVPAIRASKLLAAVDEMKSMAAGGSGPIAGKMSGRYGTSGYSMGGGGTTIAAARTPSLRSSIGLAAWGPDANRTQVPTLLMCGSIDVVAPCSMSSTAYRQIPESTPKAMATMLSEHLGWLTGPGNGQSGELGLAFQKVYLEGDTRWKELLIRGLQGGTTNIR